MKKIFLTLLVALSTVVTLSAQGRVSTKKYIISDFTDKITKVVLPGSNVLDGAIRQAVVSSWTLSPFVFSFCFRKTPFRVSSFCPVSPPAAGYPSM